MTETADAITVEISRALERLGVAPEFLAIIGGDPNSITDELERLGAHRLLLALIGSRGDTMDDEDLLAELRRYNAAG
jgi:hypothetical protein